MNHERSKSSFHRFNSAVVLGADSNGVLVMIHGFVFYVAFVGALILASPEVDRGDACKVNPNPEFCGGVK